jgi:membrane peptidoglycan carboxypeptidase
VLSLDSIRQLPQTSVLLTANNLPLAPVYEQNRYCVTLPQISDCVVRALVATEDRRFFSHNGIDLRGLCRAAYVNIRAARVLQGGSTITQQLARIAVLRRADKTLRRKLVEAWIAILIDRHFTKRQIVESYLNAAYFGHNIYGIELAARTYCGKAAAELDEKDAAYLIGLLKAPARYCRCCNEARSIDRTTVVSRLSGFDDTTSIRINAHIKKRSNVADSLPLTSPYVTRYLRRWLSTNLPEKYPQERLLVRTTIDEGCQLVAETVCGTVKEQGYRRRLACVIQDSASGEIRAFCGGLDGALQQFNAAVDGALQPGSLLKPFVLLAALKAGIGLERRYESQPLRIRLDNGQIWTVGNAGNHYTGWTTIAEATVTSDNSVYAQLMRDVGEDRVRRVLTDAGINASYVTPAIATGAITPGVSPVQMCSAYSVFSTNGYFFPPSIIESIADERGTVLFTRSPSKMLVCAPDVSRLVSDVLRRVTTQGTGMLTGQHRGLASKTGTSLSGSWFASFNSVFRVLTWTETDLASYGVHSYSGKGVSAKELADRVWHLLEQRLVSFRELFAVFSGTDKMNVRELMWVEDQCLKP